MLELDDFPVHILSILSDELKEKREACPSEYLYHIDEIQFDDLFFRIPHYKVNNKIVLCTWPRFTESQVRIIQKYFPELCFTESIYRVSDCIYIEE